MMMTNKATYKRLGDIINPISVKNTDMVTTDLRGVNYQKFFMPSVANTIGVDLSGYKLISQGQFACNLMHVGRDGCLPIALHRDEKPIIVSPAYFSFEVKNENEILSEFLFLWFKRNEFDREACFFTDADVRQGLIKSSFFDIKVPVPPIEEQRKIVAEYQAIEQRIENNRRLIATLEATAQTIYRHMFVDNIDPENLPQGWRMGVLTDIANYFNGAACQKFATDSSENIPVLKIKELGQGFTDDNSDVVSIEIPKAYIINNNDIIFSWSATLMIDYWQGGVAVLNQHLFKVSPINVPQWLTYFATKHHISEWQRIITAKATSMSHIKREDLENAKVLIPDSSTLDKANRILSPIMELFNELKREQISLMKVLSLLLTKLSNL